VRSHFPSGCAHSYFNNSVMIMTKKYGSDKQYEDYNYCPVCESVNTITDECGDAIGIHECKTKCTKCNHENYWAYGNYMQPYATISMPARR